MDWIRIMSKLREMKLADMAFMQKKTGHMTAQDTVTGLGKGELENYLHFLQEELNYRLLCEEPACNIALGQTLWVEKIEVFSFEQREEKKKQKLKKGKRGRKLWRLVNSLRDFPWNI